MAERWDDAFKGSESDRRDFVERGAEAAAIGVFGKHRPNLVRLLTAGTLNRFQALRPNAALGTWARSTTLGLSRDVIEILDRLNAHVDELAERAADDEELARLSGNAVPIFDHVLGEFAKLFIRFSGDDARFLNGFVRAATFDELAGRLGISVDEVYQRSLRLFSVDIPRLLEAEAPPEIRPLYAVLRESPDIAHKVVFDLYQLVKLIRFLEPG